MQTWQLLAYAWRAQKSDCSECEEAQRKESAAVNVLKDIGAQSPEESID